MGRRRTRVLSIALAVSSWGCGVSKVERPVHSVATGADPIPPASEAAVAENGAQSPPEPSSSAAAAHEALHPEAADARNEREPLNRDRAEIDRAALLSALQRQTLSNANRCLGEGAHESRAVVTFRTDGKVGNVQVSGDAAGTPAEKCVIAALSKATIAPQPAATSVVFVLRPRD